MAMLSIHGTQNKVVPHPRGLPFTTVLDLYNEGVSGIKARYEDIRIQTD